MELARCKICSKEFYIRPSFLRLGWGKYCSRKCHYSDKSGKKFKCYICGGEVYRMPSKVGHSKSKKYFCSKSCQTKWRNAQYIGQLHKNWRHGKAEYRSILARNGIEKVCRTCGEKDMRVLVTHHVDGNHLNNELGNLTWLCHNCHHLVHLVR